MVNDVNRTCVAQQSIIASVLGFIFVNAMLEMFHRCCNLPPLMKRHHWCELTARVHQYLARLQRVESQRLQTDAHLQRTFTHRAESNSVKSTSSRVDFSCGRLRQASRRSNLSRRHTRDVSRLKIGTGSNQL